MKNLFVIIFTFLFFTQATTAQSYTKYMQQGKSYFNKNQYLTALERFDLAYEFAKTDTEKDKAKNWKNKSRIKIRKQQAELKKALGEAEKQKRKKRQFAYGCKRSP